MATRFKDAGYCCCSLFQATMVLLLFCSVPATLVQQTTASALKIDCGATEAYKDPTTSETWVPDAPYITTGKTQTVVLPAEQQIFPERGTLRYFDDLRSKNCYTLPVVAGGTYMLRASFYYGNYDNADSPPTFQIALDATVTENATAQATPFFYEYTYVAQGNVSYLCLIRASPTSRSPFISSISLMEASDLGSNFKAFQDFLIKGIIMKTTNRINYGGTKLVRGPDDYYDRTWTAAGLNSTYNYLEPTKGAYEFVSTNETIPGLVLDKTYPPLAVMQSAVTTTGTIETYLMPQGWIEREFTFFLAIYYTELNSSAPVRNFTFSTPTLGSFDPPIIDFTGLGYLGYGAWSLRWTDAIMRENSTMLFSPLNATVAGPILSALEVFERIGPYSKKTNDRDALAIEDIKQSLDLTEWTGDPCLPSPHDWIKCTNPDSLNPVPVITSVNLTGRNLRGSIPASFANLWDLNTLDLSNNNLTGPLPEWLTTMTALRVLSVQNNQLSGVIPPLLLATNSPIRFTYRPGNEYLETSITPESGPTPPCTSNCTKKSSIGLIVGASVGGLIGLLIVLVLAIFACRRWKRKRNPSGAEQGPPRPQLMRITTTGGAKAYTLPDVTDATFNFKRELGKGGFGPVYYGRLPAGQEVAVKVANGSSKHEGKEFYNEVDVLSKVHHKNLVSLVGYCQEEEAQILLYEYMHNGSLFDHLHGKSANSGVLDWQRRLHIAINAAQGLEYLHTGCSPSFIHRDVKSSNILLNSKWEAKVADFGLARLLGESEGTRAMTNIMGTAGYLDPEYYTSHYISTKSDVYSFGIVLLELLTGSLPIDKSAPMGRDPNLAQWVRESLMRNDIDSVLDPAIKASHPNMEAVWKVAEVAMQSVEPKGIHRPTMSNVVQELQGALTMEATNVQPTNVQPTSSEFLSNSYRPYSYLTPR